MHARKLYSTTPRLLQFRTLAREYLREFVSYRPVTTSIFRETENGYTCAAVLPRTTGLIGLLELKAIGPDGELKTTNNLPYSVNVTCNEALGYYTLVNVPTEPIFHLWCLSLTGSPGSISTMFKNYMKTYY